MKVELSCVKRFIFYTKTRNREVSPEVTSIKIILIEIFLMKEQGIKQIHRNSIHVYGLNQILELFIINSITFSLCLSNHQQPLMTFSQKLHKISIKSNFFT